MSLTQIQKVHKPQPLMGANLKGGDVIPKKCDTDHIMRVELGSVRLWLGQQIQGDFVEDKFADLKAGLLYAIEALEDGTVISFTETPRLIV